LTAAPQARHKTDARAGREGKGVQGKGIPAPPSLSAAAEFRTSETGAPQKNMESSLPQPARARTTIMNPPLMIFLYFS